MEDELKTILEATNKLRTKYGRSFPLDGRLVGDMGEVLVKRDYLIELHEENNELYDAFELYTNRQVQIKSSMKYNFSFPYKNLPEYYMAVHIREDAKIEVIYNGSGQVIKNYILQNNIKAYNNTWYPLSVGILKKLNANVSDLDRIKKR